MDTLMNAQEKAKMEETLKIFFARRRKIEDLSQETNHNSYFYRGKWHLCSCPECKKTGR